MTLMYKLEVGANWVIAFAVLGISQYIGDLTPYKRPFQLGDASISHPQLPSIVPSSTNIVLAIVVPFCVVALWLSLAFITKRFILNRKREEPNVEAASRLVDGESVASDPQERQRQTVSLWDSLGQLHRFVLGLLLAWATAVIITDCLKFWYGRLRPDFLSRCQFEFYPGKENATSTAWLFEGVDGICKGEPSNVAEGRRSFPSGHASTSFSGLTFFSLWIAGTAGLLPVGRRPQLALGQRTHLIFVALAPLLLAAYVAISRTQQYIHHNEDVLFGSFFGVASAYVVFRLFYSRRG
ncbi:phosphatidic acid phosphatase type 2/haloperoxidase [Cladochytrium replicatum]|nr:phosphatidic acid phosphatase type 2/haloperoxidase [Cladochytrium replicatum]